MKHDMDPNSNVNYRRKIGPLFGNKTSDFQSFDPTMF